MSLGIVLKGPEGIVLAADSRVTLIAKTTENELIHATFDNTTKLLRVNAQNFVGIVTYGLGAIGTNPRTAHSYLPEFEAELGKERLKIEAIANRLSEFFMKRWSDQGMPEPEQWKGKPDMVFLLGGYDEGETYGRLFEVGIPSQPTPKQWHEQDFGAVWGGQTEFVGRLIHGYDPGLQKLLQESMGLSDDGKEKFRKALLPLQTKIPFQFLPLQDCINLCTLLVRTTIEMQSFYIGVRGVGGNIDVAAITKTCGFQPIQEKSIARLFNSREDS